VEVLGFFGISPECESLAKMYIFPKNRSFLVIWNFGGTLSVLPTLV